MSGESAAPFGANGRDRAADLARRYITRKIDLKEIKPGEKLPSAASLSAEIGVNRPAVLEALKVLENQGKVRVGLGVAGVTVPEADDRVHRAARLGWMQENRETILQMALLREALEPLVVRLAAQQGLSKRQTNSARSLLRAMSDLVEGPYQDYLALDIQFHQIIAASSGVPLIADVLDEARAWVTPAFDVIPWPENRRHTSTSEHDQILKAVIDGDAPRAERHAQAHVKSSAKLIEAMLGREIG